VSQHTGQAAELVGREPEKQAIERFVASLPGGAAALVVNGPTGIGKTVLWAYGVRIAEPAARVLTCRPAQVGAQLSYSGLSQLFDGLQELFGSLPEPDAHALRFALRLEGPGASAVDHTTVAAAAVDVLRMVAGDPLVLAIDDLQWLDPSSARIVGLVLRQLGDRPLGVLATQRGDDVPAVLPSGLSHDRVRLMPLSPFTEAETDALIRTSLGAVLRRPVLGEVHRASAGNPLFALEIARALLQHRDPLPPGAPLPVPGSLRELVGHRVAALSAAAREVLLVAAMAPGATVQVLENALGRGCAAGLQRAVDAGILEIDHGHLRFTHPLLAAATYAQADTAHRRRMHLRLASLTCDVEERARHLSAATQLPDAAVAAQVQAGAVAAHRRGDPDAASALAEAALRLTPENDPPTLVRRTVAAADYLWEAGHAARCEILLRRLVSELPPGPDRARVLRRVGFTTAVVRSWQDSRIHLKQGLSEAGDDAGLRAALHRDLAFGIVQTGDVRAAGGHLAEAYRLANDSTDPGLLGDVEATQLMQMVIAGGTPVDELVPRLTALAAAGAGDRLVHGIVPLVMVAAALKWADEFAASGAILTRMRSELWSQQEDGLLLPVLFQLSELESWSGHLQAARVVADLARETGTRSGLTGSATMWLYPAALADARLGHLDQARTAAAASLAAAEQAGDRRPQMRALAVLGFADLCSGNAQLAVRSLGGAAALQHELGYEHPGVIRSAGDEIEALLAAGDHVAAGDRLAVLGRQAARTGSRWAQAVTRRCRGLLEAANHRLDAAQACLQEAAEDPLVPDPLEKARTLLALGAVLRRARRRSQARESIEEALAAFQAMGASVWTAKAAAELYVSVKTVEAHLSSIYRKLGVRSRTELAAHLLSPPTPGNGRDSTDSPGP
jgi:tetratricopeptide (TPR) repeat protein